MSLITFTEAKLSATGKKGILTPDEHGYYTHVIGGLNTFNSAGEWYMADGAKDLFEQSSSFMRRIKTGTLKGELGHPKRPTNMTVNDYMRRVMTIEETNVCVHYSDVYLDVDYGRKNPQYKNPKLIAIIGKLKPSGVHGPALQASLDNPRENVCFSIRALTKDQVIQGTNYRTLVQIITWDHVVEPGIATSNKWDSPAMETISETPVTLVMLEQMAADNNAPFAIESRDVLNDSIKLVTMAVRPVAVPIYTNW